MTFIEFHTNVVATSCHLYIITQWPTFQTFSMKYLAMSMIYMHANVINQLYHGSAHVRAIMHSLTLVHYRIVHAHELWYK